MTLSPIHASTSRRTKARSFRRNCNAGRNERILSMNPCWTIGLATKPSAPASQQAGSSPGLDAIRTIVERRSGSLLILLHVSSPPMPGIWSSRTMRAGRSRRSTSRASSPEEAVRISQTARRRKVFSSSRKSRTSSTSRIFSGKASAIGYLRASRLSIQRPQRNNNPPVARNIISPLRSLPVRPRYRPIGR